jgi:putative methyltransferase (TIGR04325 family)
MYLLLNNFLKSKYFNKLPKFLARRIFKIFKIFFVETNLQSLPNINHPPTINISEQKKILENKNDQFYRPFSTCLYSLEILALYQTIKDKIRIIDFGANNIDNFIYLNRYLKNWEYIYHDQPAYNKCIADFVKDNNLKNISVENNLSNIKEDIDFVFFGSSIHYVNEYKEILNKIYKIKPKYLVFSHTPFYISDKNDKDIVMKQLNIHPTINYAYLIEYYNFIKLMKENNYKLISQNKNNFIKFLNFKNFKDFSFISFLDLIFINTNR